MNKFFRFCVGAYLGITSVYGTVYLACIVVPKPVENMFWYIAVDGYAAATMIIAAATGALLAVRA